MIAYNVYIIYYSLYLCVVYVCYFMVWNVVIQTAEGLQRSKAAVRNSSEARPWEQDWQGKLEQTGEVGTV